MWGFGVRVFPDDGPSGRCNTEPVKIQPSRATAVAVGLWVASVAGVGVGSYLQWLNRAAPMPDGTEGGPGVAFFAGMLVFTTTGVLVAAHRPGNPVGWLLVAEGLAWQLFGLAGQYRVGAVHR